jgi:hypothetical protein
MALICMSQGRQHSGGGGIRRPEQSAIPSEDHHHRRPSSKDRQRSREASPSTRNRIRPLASLASDSGTAEEVSGTEQPAVVDRILNKEEEEGGGEEEEKENRAEEDMAEAAAAMAAEAAADQPDDCDSGCECEPEETEGNAYSKFEF